METASNGPRGGDVTVASAVDILGIASVALAHRSSIISRERRDGRQQRSSQTRGRQAIQFILTKPHDACANVVWYKNERLDLLLMIDLCSVNSHLLASATL